MPTIECVRATSFACAWLVSMLGQSHAAEWRRLDAAALATAAAGAMGLDAV